MCVCVKSGALLLKTGSAVVCVRLKHEEQNLHAKRYLEPLEGKKLFNQKKRERGEKKLFFPHIT